MTKETILLIHAIFGVIVFVSGFLQIFLKKGGKIHRNIGQVYMYSWIFLIASGAYLGGLLITIVGIFGFYFALTGARIGRLKHKPMGVFEKIIFALGLLVAVAMLYYVFVLLQKGDQSFAIIFAVFGAIFLFTTVKDVFKYNLNKPLDKQVYGKLDWYFEHFKRMCISFIAALTAFTSIQNVFQNNTANFLIPTAVGTVLIVVATKFYRKKLLK